jgi:hypothetical protein
MNERIRELAEQAVLFRLDPDSECYEAMIHPEDLERFAELIVRECLEWCDAHATIDGSAQQVRNSIKNHFGVE